MDRNDSWPACESAEWERPHSLAHGRRRSKYRVPDLQLHFAILDVDHARAELHANGEVVHGAEPLVREL